MLTGYIRGQELRISTPEIAADSIKYLEAEFHFAGRDWDGYVKTAYFINGTSKFALVLADDRITADMGLNLTAGEWEVKLSGVKGGSRITTTTEHIFVREFGGTDGTLPDVTATEAEQILAKIGDLSNLTTEDKTNLVAAINEAAKSGGGSGGGKDGTGIASITYKGKGEDGGNVYTVLLTDGTSYEITAPKGAKGADGAPGAKGDTGATGATGATPNLQIGEVTTLDAGSDATATITGTEENPLLNLGIPKGAKGNDGAGMGITGATVGQIAKITAVDASGAPTAWEPVDIPTGGGEEWRKVIDAEVTEPTVEFIADGLNGATELHIAWSNLQNASTTNSGLSVKINDILIGAYQTAAAVQKKDSTTYGWTHLKFDGLHWIMCKSSGALTASNITQSTAYTLYNLVENVGAANTIKFEAPITQYAPISGKLEVWTR